ncbi:hypothetical protein [Paraburkholderia kirstenboschensis]|uniref:Uncharacterized protein n=1 Tax=Paraburkholderia kirstenboschensis TaxID=1245436 RepID=A0ABZ0EEH6_9BURK|nr:hypothetical protein [Paraburkholderia kirstenboschensis]WOD14627.1 hypothetical protein RW095_04225 [Paraburkholderia kirstenboschensis]
MKYYFSILVKENLILFAAAGVCPGKKSADEGHENREVCNQKSVCAVRESTDKADFHGGDEGLDLVRSDKPIEPIAPE